MQWNDEYSQYESAVECGECALLKSENKKLKKAINKIREQLRYLSKNTKVNVGPDYLKEILWDLEIGIK